MRREHSFPSPRQPLLSVCNTEVRGENGTAVLLGQLASSALPLTSHGAWCRLYDQEGTLSPRLSLLGRPSHALGVRTLPSPPRAHPSGSLWRSFLRRRKATQEGHRMLRQRLQVPKGQELLHLEETFAGEFHVVMN